MTVEELAARFPEIPRDLHGEPVLARFAEAFDALLRVARNPGACSAAYDAGNHYYLKLMGPVSIYAYGLATRERVVEDLEALLAQHRADPQGFAASLVPGGAADHEVRGPGCH